MAALWARSGAGWAVRLQLQAAQAGRPGSQRCSAASTYTSVRLAGGCLMTLITLTMGELASAFPMSEPACTAHCSSHMLHLNILSQQACCNCSFPIMSRPAALRLRNGVCISP